MKKRILKVRYRERSGPKSRLVLQTNGKKVKSKGGRKVLSIRKVSRDEIWSASTPGGVGEFFNPDKLMQECAELRLQEVTANG